ncbi:MAG TPA: DUF6391 domain-containing protein [Ktedonobacterales bacterium]
MNVIEQAWQQMTLGAPVRENHALEHATIVLLSKRYPDTRFSGISFARGFFVFGDVPTEAVRPAAEAALALLRGEHPDMAIHERCGTNLAVAGILTSAAAMSVARLRRPYSNFNNVLLATTAAMIAARPVGLLVQRYLTTRTPASNMRIVQVARQIIFGAPAHFVTTDHPVAHIVPSAETAARA